MRTDYWYSTLGQEFGPVSLETIHELARTGILDSADLVRVGPHGAWMPLRLFLEPAPPEPPPAQDVDCAGGSHSLPSTSHQQHRTRLARDESISKATLECLVRLRDRRTQLRPGKAEREPSALLATTCGLAGLMASMTGRILRVSARFVATLLRLPRPVHWKMAGAVLVVLVLMALGRTVALRWYSPAQAFNTLQMTADEVARLRERGAGHEQWAAFQIEGSARVESLVRRLERLARPEDPVSLELLWAARDYLPVIIGTAGENAHADQKFRLHMARAEKLLGPREKIVVDWAFVSIIACDVFIAGWLCLVWLRKRARG